jgi:hypothetical protein
MGGWGAHPACFRAGVCLVLHPSELAHQEGSLLMEPTLRRIKSERRRADPPQTVEVKIDAKAPRSASLRLLPTGVNGSPDVPRRDIERR